MISNLGFPIVVSLILIFKVEDKIDQLNDSIKDLIKEIERFNEKN
jgi:hypothetical protein